MKRVMMMLFAVVLLVGCSSPKSIDDSIKDGLAAPLPITHNHRKPLVNYYLPPSVGLKQSNAFSSLFMVRGNDVLMNLNIEHAISEMFEYESMSEKNKEIFDYTYSGTYMNDENNLRHFDIMIKSLSNNRSAMFIDNSDVGFITVVSVYDLPYVIETLITIMRSVNVDTPKVVAQYSNKDVKKAITIYSEFFERVPPETGTLEEMYNQLQP